MTDLETAKMSERGQIIIPKEIRDHVHATQNTIFTIMPLDKETIIMKKLNKNKIIDEFRNIRKRVIKLSKQDIDKEIQNVRKQ